MRTKLIWAVIVLQVGVLAFMAGEREWILRTGQTMWLRTAPVDPRDPMRGDYVRFDYELAHVPKALCRDGVLSWFASLDRRASRVRDRVVFVQVKRDEDGIAELVSASDARPASGEYVRGRVQQIDPLELHVRFGLEARFTEQGRARDFEVARGQRPGVPLDIAAAVSGGGVAVMKDYRWEPLGITVTPDRPAQSAPGARPGGQARNRPVTGLTVELKNHSDKPVAIVVRPDGESFRLVPIERGAEAPYRWANENAVPAKPSAEFVHVLQPGDSHREHLDFSRRHWWLRDARPAAPSPEPIPWDKVENAWGAWFRLEYAPPMRAETAGLPHADLIRHTRVRSRMFSPLAGSD